HLAHREAGLDRRPGEPRDAAAELDRLEAAVPRLEDGAGEPVAAARPAHLGRLPPIEVEAERGEGGGARPELRLLAGAGERRDPAPLGEEAAVDAAAVQELATQELAVLPRGLPEPPRGGLADRPRELGVGLRRAGH